MSAPNELPIDPIFDYKYKRLAQDWAAQDRLYDFPKSKHLYKDIIDKIMKVAIRKSQSVGRITQVRAYLNMKDYMEICYLLKEPWVERGQLRDSKGHLALWFAIHVGFQNTRVYVHPSFNSENSVIEIDTEQTQRCNLDEPQGLSQQLRPRPGVRYLIDLDGIDPYSNSEDLEQNRFDPWDKPVL